MRTPEENDRRILQALSEGKIQVDLEKGEILGRPTWIIKSGYRAFEIHESEGRLRATAHRTILLAKLGRPLLPGHEVGHLNHNKLDNRPGNLREVTRRENIQENVRARRHCYGATHGRAHLTDAQVRKIRELLEEGRLTQREIAKKVGSSQPHVSAIHLGRYRSEVL